MEIQDVVYCYLCGGQLRAKREHGFYVNLEDGDSHCGICPLFNSYEQAQRELQGGNMGFVVKVKETGAESLTFADVKTGELVAGFGSGDIYLKVSVDRVYNLTQRHYITGAGLNYRRLPKGSVITLSVN